jgi:hypothetical protein
LFAGKVKERIVMCAIRSEWFLMCGKRIKRFIILIGFI